jgi:hypothetical protein
MKKKGIAFLEKIQERNKKTQDLSDTKLTFVCSRTSPKIYLSC